MPDLPESRPLRIAVVNDYAIVVAGLAAVLAPFADRVEVVETDSQLPVVSDVDLVLYDSFGQPQGRAMHLDQLVRDEGGTPIVVFSWNTDPDLVDQALQSGAAGYLSKGLEPEQLVDALERIMAGERLDPTRERMPEGDRFGRWPGDEEGLTAREAEVLALLCQGLSNEDIAARAFLALPTVKTHLRTIFSKLGLQSRTQVVLWGVQHGFRPDILRELGGARHPSA